MTSTPSFPTRRQALLTLGAAAAASVLPACSNNDNNNNDGTAQVRAINLSSDIASADLFFNDTKSFAALLPDTITAYSGIASADYTARVKKPDGTQLLEGTYSLAKDRNYTAVIWGREGATRLSTLPENEDDNAISANSARLRVFSATSDSGSVDVFLTSPTADLGSVAASVSNVAAGQLTGFKEVLAGTYRLRVTGAGDVGDLRLDIPSITLNLKKHTTLILTPGSGGVLVNGRLIEQQGATVGLANTKARLRVVASADNAANVAVTAGATTVVAALRSASIGVYELVDAGAVPVSVRVNGVVVDTQTRTIAAGSDYTLLVYGTGSVSLIADDNRLPAVSSRVKVRLLHGAAGVDPLTLQVNSRALITGLPVGGASAYVSIDAVSSVPIDVTSPSSAAPIYSATGLNLLAQGVYTVYVLGGNSTTTTRVIKER